MRILSLVFFLIAAVVLTAGACVSRLPELAAVSGAVAALAVVPFAFPRPSLTHALLVLFGGVIGAFALFHTPALLCVGAMAAALSGWDAGLVVPQLDAASAPAKRSFALRYALRSAALAPLSILLVGAAGAIRVPLAFGSGLGLSVTVLLLAALLLRAFLRAGARGKGERRPRAQ